VSAFIVDASVVVKWFVPEVDSEVACQLLNTSHDYYAPRLLFAETAKTIWKKIRREELAVDRGQRLVEDISRIAVHTVPCRGLAEEARVLANATATTVYDALYLALAVRLKTRVITADERFASAVSRISMTAPHITLLQAFKG
jgi:predicted nucleic acid-binding protein